MARRTKTESALTRARILDAAETQMLVHGVTQTSLERIARSAGVTRGAIYWHFSDKAALLEAMVQRTATPLSELYGQLGQHIPKNEPMCLLREMLLHNISRLASDEQHRRVCRIVLHRCEMKEASSAATELVNTMFKDGHDTLVSLCREIQATHATNPLLSHEETADIIMAFMVGLYECRLRHPDLCDITNRMEAKVNALLSGLFREAADTA